MAYPHIRNNHIDSSKVALLDDVPPPDMMFSLRSTTDMWLSGDVASPKMLIFADGPLEGLYGYGTWSDVFIPNIENLRREAFRFCWFMPKASTFQKEKPVPSGNVTGFKQPIVQNQGKVFWARAKELFVWSPSFKDVPEKELFSDDESAKINEQANNLNNDEVENASEVVSDTYFGDNGEVQGFERNLVRLIDRSTVRSRIIPEAESDRPPSRTARSNSRVLEEAENSVDRVSSESFSNGVKIKKDGSILEILDEMITVGQTWAFSNGRLYLESLITSWNGESLIMGDFNEVRCIEERWGSVFNSHGAIAFNSFISYSGLNDIQLEGFSFTWVHPLATKMSKLDRFLMSNGLLSAFPLISAICLDRHLSDHRPILLKEVFSDFGPTPFRFYHSWLELPGFDDLVSKSWNSFTLDDSN
ncbi:RNA-directed DNA polymerase, eukaryota, partial [Tanacetum coccineum]